MQVWNVLHAARCKYRTPKSRHLCTIAQLCRAISSQLRHVSTIGKNLLGSNISSTRPRNTVNFGPFGQSAYASLIYWLIDWYVCVCTKNITARCVMLNHREKVLETRNMQISSEVLVRVCVCVSMFFLCVLLLLFFSDCRIYLFSSLAARVFNKRTRYS